MSQTAQLSTNGRNLSVRIGDAQLLPLEQAQRVVGQYLHPLHGVQAADEVGRSVQAVLVIDVYKRQGWLR